MVERITRRGLIAGGGGLLLAGCDRLNQPGPFKTLLIGAADAHRGPQQLLGGLAPEFTAAQMSPIFRVNGNADAKGNAEWAGHAASGFARWALRVDGLVARPLLLPLDALRAMPQRSQITRHDCVEGWSAIARWQGPQLGRILALAGVLPQARYAVFHCADAFGTTPYYESLDLTEASHPQTILAHAMNGAPLPVGHGAPLRLRAERHLGYKQAKYVMRIEAVATLAGLYGGKGGYWEDHSGYQWWGGI